MCVFLTKAQLSLVKKRLICGSVVKVKVSWKHLMVRENLQEMSVSLCKLCRCDVPHWLPTGNLKSLACQHTDLFFCRIPAKHQHASIVTMSMFACWCKHVAQSTASKSCWHGCRLLTLFHWISVSAVFIVVWSWLHPTQIHLNSHSVYSYWRPWHLSVSVMVYPEK